MNPIPSFLPGHYSNLRWILTASLPITNCLNRGVDPIFHLANTWPKITARDVYAMVSNRKEQENLDFSLVAATFEKAITYVFAESLIRNAEARSSTLLCSTINPSVL